MNINSKLFNILIVDDNLNNLNVLSGILAKKKYKVRRAINGKLALRTIELLHPDLILLDIKLPDINGYEVCQNLKNNPKTKDIPIIFISALNDSFDKVHAFELGGVDYITKPFEIMEVLARVENQLRIESAKREIQDLNTSLEEKVRSRTAQLESAKNEIFKLLVQERENHQLRSSFITMISHEFRTPLTSFITSVEILENYHDRLDSLEKKNIFLQIYFSINRLNNLLDDVLTLNKIDERKIIFNAKKIDLVEFCKKSVNGIKKQIGSDRYINFVFDSNLSTMNIDEFILQLIFKNLIENAIKYSPNGKPITFEVLQNNDNIVFKIADKGIGIDPQLGDRLFEAFERGQNVDNIPGTGLGLSIVKKLVDFLSGEIKVDSKLDQGTTFTVSLCKDLTCKIKSLN